MVPRGSAPAITRALAMPGSGEAISCVVKASHWPVMALVLSVLEAMRLSMSVLEPIVPARITTEEGVAGA